MKDARRERSVGEIDDIHVEMDDVIAETLGEELEGSAGSPLRILSDLFQPDACKLQPPDLTSFEPRRMGRVVGEQQDLVRLEHWPIRRG